MNQHFMEIANCPLGSCKYLAHGRSYPKEKSGYHKKIKSETMVDTSSVVGIALCNLSHGHMICYQVCQPIHVRGRGGERLSLTIAQSHNLDTAYPWP